MPLVLTGTSSFSVRYMDVSGVEQFITVRKGQDAELLGLPPHAMEQLREAGYGASNKRYFTETKSAPKSESSHATQGMIDSSAYMAASAEAKAKQDARSEEAAEQREENMKKAAEAKKAAPKKRTTKKKVVRKKASSKKAASKKKAESKESEDS